MIDLTPDKKEQEQEVEYYGDPQISSGHAKVPLWLTASYIFWIVFGLIWLVLYWNGSWGWVDRGYWQELQRAANTTFPTQDSMNPK